MRQIIVSRNFENEDVRDAMKELIAGFPKKNKVSQKDKWILSFDKTEDYYNAIMEFAVFFTEQKLAEVVIDFCCGQEMDGAEAQRTINAYFMAASDMIDYCIKTTGLLLKLYLEIEPNLNVESFMLFNMKRLKDEAMNDLSNPDFLENLSCLVESSILDKIAIVQCIGEIQACMEKIGITAEKVKDFKVFQDNTGIKCLTENNVLLNLKYLKTKYNININVDFSDDEIILILAGIFSPSRIILFSSVSREASKSIEDGLNIIDAIIGEVGVFHSHEKFPM